MVKKLRGYLVVAVALGGSFAAQAVVDAEAVQTQASAFQADFLSVATIIGLAYMTAAYGAVIWKWIKGMIFN